MSAVRTSNGTITKRGNLKTRFDFPTPSLPITIILNSRALMARGVTETKCSAVSNCDVIITVSRSAMVSALHEAVGFLTKVESISTSLG